MKILKVKNLNVKIGDREIIRDVNFEINQGEFLVILGRSGTGKTTLLKAIAGLIPFEGEIIFKGKNIGFAFQDNALFENLNVFENAGFYLLEKYGFSDKIKEKIEEVLNMCGLLKFSCYYPSELSGGMQKRLAIARAVLTPEAEMILLDEPTTALDPMIRADILRLISRIKEEGKTIIMSTQEVEDALLIGEKFILISEGKQKFFGDKEKLIEENKEFFAPFLNQLKSLKHVTERSL